jgi:predicted Zn finger-like uncharacterized protein
MLITTCAQCKARFRVTPQQLNARQGQVRCGRCRAVFNGFEALERFPDDDTGARLLAAQEAEQRAANETLAGIETLPDEDNLPEIESIEKVPPIPAAAAAPMTEPPATPSKPHRPRGPRSASASAAATAPPLDELLLAPPPRKPVARAWSFGVALLAIVLVLELTFAFRAAIAQRYPALRPVMEAVCARTRCTVPWSRDEALLKLEESEMLEVPGKPTEIALGARIRNLASVSQEYPHLELTLTDFTGQAAARRVLRPTDYLGRPLTSGEVIAPGTEVSLQLRLETPRIKATGYELMLFYP